MERSRLRSIVFDCARPAPLARFWADILGYRVRPYDEAERARLRAAGIEDVEDDPSVALDPPGDGPTLWFVKVPEGKVAKNRVHLDVSVGADLEGDERRATVEREVARLVDLGATELGPKEQHGEFWVVLQDPEGNEFCVA